jgi:hypothetical protein
MQTLSTTIAQAMDQVVRSMPPAGAFGSGIRVTEPLRMDGRGSLSIPSAIDRGRSQAGTWPPVKVVRPVGRSTLTGGQNPAPLACGPTADGMNSRAGRAGARSRQPKAARRQQAERHAPTGDDPEQQIRAAHGNHRQRLAPRGGVRDEEAVGSNPATPTRQMP